MSSCVVEAPLSCAATAPPDRAKMRPARTIFPRIMHAPLIAVRRHRAQPDDSTVTNGYGSVKARSGALYTFSNRMAEARTPVRRERSRVSGESMPSAIAFSGKYTEFGAWMDRKDWRVKNLCGRSGGKCCGDVAAAQSGACGDKDDRIAPGLARE